METKFTPGPWKVEPVNYDGDGGTLVRFNGVCIANVWGVLEYRQVDEESSANAHLIAAAPELYEAMEDLLTVLADRKYKGFEARLESHSRIARAALAKARGE